MIGLLRGQILDCQPTRVILDVQGVGYEVFIPISTYDKISKAAEAVTLFTHLNVREDALQLYGFVTIGEKSLFQKLIAVSGIGPKVALGILSSAPAEEFMRHVRNGDVSRLKALPGIGKKTAERLILELKDKFGGELAAVHSTAASAIQSDAIDEAMMALLSLGYSRANVEKTLQKVADSGAQDVESLVKAAFRHL